MNWRDIQNRLAENGDINWSICPACNEKVLQAVGSLHVNEEHPEIANNIRKAAVQNEP